jgi:plasmid stabilization system protein ParE
VGEPELTREETDAYFAARPAYRHVSAPDEEDGASALANYRLQDEEAGLTLTFAYDPEVAEGEDTPGRADFPYEETPLELDVDYCQPDTARQAAIREVEAVVSALGLLVQDPQLGSEEPSRLDPGALERSYTRSSEEVAQTITYLRNRRRKLVLIGAALLLAGFLLLLLSALGIGR